MLHNYVFADINEALPKLAEEILTYGSEDESRAGKTKELIHVGVTLTDPLRRETVLLNRKGSLAAQIAETMWVLSGRDDVEWLSHYLPRAKDFSDNGTTWRGAYGKRIRAWGGGSNRKPVDQLRWVVSHLAKEPSSRRAVISIYDPMLDQYPGKDIPCNDWLDFKIRNGYLYLHVAVRSNDLIWGWSGINAFEWSALLEIVAELLGVQVGNLSFSISSLHLYEHHWDRAKAISGEVATKYELSPRFRLPESVSFDDLLVKWFTVEEMIRAGNPHAGAMVEEFPEPMFRSWLRVLQWWWSGVEENLSILGRGNALSVAARVGVQPKTEEKEVDDINNTDFCNHWSKLHATKNAAYGDSWKRRGEQVGIWANIARKVDRLGKTDDTETASDTAGDLLVYLIKYRWWLYDNGRMIIPFQGCGSSEEERVGKFLRWLDRYSGWKVGVNYEDRLNRGFDKLIAIDNNQEVGEILYHMIRDANALARKEFWKANNAKRSWKGYGDE